MPACRYVEENGSAAIVVTKRSAGVTPKVNLKEYATYMSLPSVNKAAHSGFETQRIYHQKFKVGVSVAPRKDLCPPKIYLKKIDITIQGLPPHHPDMFKLVQLEPYGEGPPQTCSYYFTM